MEVKKHRKHNINRNSGIYFSLGLALVLFLTYLSLEWKTYEKEYDWNIEISEVEELDVPLVPVIKVEKPKQKIVKTPPLIEIIEDHKEAIETVIAPTDIDQNTSVIAIDSIEVPEKDLEEVPFIRIEEVPVFPGCEGANDKRACFQEMIMEHVRKNFRYPQLAQEMGLQGRVSIAFKIEKDGSIGDVRMRGPHKILEEEVGRIISKLPRMIPGKQRGRAVKVPFMMPIVFKLQ
ncbi:MAG: energy transducer TonB [Flavobacteriaceae bacterium]|nr:TonB family protein [Eudoraea sp.]NNJ39139.1 energy transducer TonB [Flavobacteriaceae bacterium]